MSIGYRSAVGQRDWSGPAVLNQRCPLGVPSDDDRHCGQDLEGIDLNTQTRVSPASSFIGRVFKNRYRRHLRAVVAAPPLALALALAGCGQTASSPPSTGGKATPPTAVVIKTATVDVNGSPETVLTNSGGRTLYYFTKDASNKIACSGSCATLWPPLTGSGSTVNAPSGVSGTFTLYNGANGNQVEYNGHPLYIYSVDTGPDQSHGEGVLGEWYVATPSIPVAPASSPTSSSGTSGY